MGYKLWRINEGKIVEQNDTYHKHGKSNNVLSIFKNHTTNGCMGIWGKGERINYI